MLKLIRMIQQEQDIRMRTRAAEQEHRKNFPLPHEYRQFSSHDSGAFPALRRRSGSRSGIFRQAQGNGIKLARTTGRAQADTSDLILGETNEEVVDLLKNAAMP
ncbi:MAG: hypothetical protein ACLSUW_06375 [Akkermansia sp.]